MNALDLLAALPAMLWTARADGVWTHVNRRWTAYTGRQGDDSRFGFEGALHPDDVGPTVARWTESVRTGDPYQAEYRVRRHDGEYRWFLTHGVRTPDLDPDVVWTGTCTDIHDQKQAEHDADAARQSAVRALGLALEVRDHETKGHTDRVTGLALRLGTRAGLSASELNSLRVGAYLHDIGKMGVPDAILLKPGPLTSAEWREMKRHVQVGEQFAASLGFLSQEVLEVIRGHHERWDGSGYPRGLQGEEIPRLARIFALADVYDALVSERPYKQAWSSERAAAEIAAQAGQQFDPHLTGLFADIIWEGATGGDLGPEPALARRVPAISEQLQAQALHEAAISVLITDAQQRLVYVNPAFCRRTGYTPEEVLGRNPRFLQGPKTAEKDKLQLRKALAAGQAINQRILNYSKAGEELWFDMYITPIVRVGQLEYFVAVQQDSSAQVADHARLEDLATHDTLTGLLNRFSLESALTQGVEPSALIFLDLDNFKGINDQYGHQVGDRVLQAVARTLQAQTPEGGQVFRLGGDEFLTLLPVIQEQEAAQYVAQLRKALATVETGDGLLTGSFGVALFPQDGQDLWALMGLADERMYQEKLGSTRRRTAARKAGSSGEWSRT